MKSLYTLVCAAVLSILFCSESLAQGCVAVRNITSGTNGFLNEAKSWQFSANYRFFHSYKHIVGSDHQEQREEQNTNVMETPGAP